MWLILHTLKKIRKKDPISEYKWGRMFLLLQNALIINVSSEKGRMLSLELDINHTLCKLSESFKPLNYMEQVIWEIDWFLECLI